MTLRLAEIAHFVAIISSGFISYQFSLPHTQHTRTLLSVDWCWTSYSLLVFIICWKYFPWNDGLSSLWPESQTVFLSLLNADQPVSRSAEVSTAFVKSFKQRKLLIELSEISLRNEEFIPFQLIRIISRRFMI